MADPRSGRRRRWFWSIGTRSGASGCYRRPASTTLTASIIRSSGYPRASSWATNIVNLIVKHATVIFEMEPQDPSLPIGRRRDIEALTHVFAVGARACWSCAAAATLAEIDRTLHEQLRHDLADYVMEML